jgi:hypothetical protein
MKDPALEASRPPASQLGPGETAFLAASAECPARATPCKFVVAVVVQGLAPPLAQGL